MKKSRNYILMLLLTLVSGSLLADCCHIECTIPADCCRTECTIDDSCDCEITSRSYLAVRPLFQSASPEKVSGFRSDRLHAKEDGWHGTAEMAIFGSKSTNDIDLARYFFPFCKTILIAGGNVTDGASLVLPTSSKPADLLASNFNVITVNEGFKSEISIRPQQSVVGAGFQLRKAISMDEENGRGFFTSISFPIERVSNNLKFNEKILNDGGGAANITCVNTVANMTEAFQQPGWDFGKIQMCPRSKTGIADIELKVGYEWIQEEPFHLESYLGILIPTGNKPSGEYLFEPIVGHGRHWGIMFGNSLGIEIWSDEVKDRSLRMEYNAHTQYLFRNTQCRSVDLVCKPWSRYMSMYRNIDQAVTAQSFSGDREKYYATPGINVLTMPLKVRPGFSHNATTAAQFRSAGWRGELGYNLYCRQAECVKLACPWIEGPALKRFNGNGQTNPVRDITGNARLENATGRIALQDYKYNMIKESDLDLISASSPSIITHTIYLAGGYTFEDYDYPTFLTAGGSYEFNKSNNAGVERWTIWGKLGFSF